MIEAHLIILEEGFFNVSHSSRVQITNNCAFDDETIELWTNELKKVYLTYGKDLFGNKGKDVTKPLELYSMSYLCGYIGLWIAQLEKRPELLCVRTPTSKG